MHITNAKSAVLLMAVLLASMALFSCHHAKHEELRASRADSLIFAAGAVMNYPRLLELADSFEMTGDISPLDANRWRGVFYYRQNQYRMAELCYRKAVDCDINSDLDQLNYNKAARRLSELLLVKGDYEGSLQIAIPAVEKMDKTGIGSDIDYAILLNNIGCCQLNLGRDKDADESFKTAREHYANRFKTDSTSRGFQEAVVGTVYTSMAYINTRRYAESIYWIDRTEMLLNLYRQRPDARTAYFDEYQGRIGIMRAVALQGLNKTREAKEEYSKFLKTNYSQTSAGRINANDYLVAAQRYREAADNYRFLDKALSDWGMELSLDNIQLYMLPKYRANVEARRRDSAVVAAVRILDVLDSAISNQKTTAMAELATIYNTNQKEAQIARQQADLTRTRYIGTLSALSLLVVFFVIYIFNRRKASQRLAAAHSKLEEAHGKLEEAHGKLEEAHGELQHAYDRLEATTKAKERIESELRIARNIQRSIVPSVFPEYEGLDMYAYMMPAKEVGGDLYDFLIEGDRLYFCLGDVSGKSVPAALFMAQAARMFRVMAKQHMMPADIANRMNNELTEGNENGMFVTMFIALVNLTTGQMNFCNCGHNPPVIDGRFIEMEPNAPVGLWEELQYVGEEIADIRGKQLFVYTDGLNEAENPQQQQFGDDRLLHILQEVRSSSASQVINRLTDAVERHRDGAEPNDDLTMLCLLLK